MTALPVHLRRRPWLVPCVVILVIGGTTMASYRLGSLLFWLGAAEIALGLLAVLVCEMEYWRKRTGRKTQLHEPARNRR